MERNFNLILFVLIFCGVNIYDFQQVIKVSDSDKLLYYDPPRFDIKNTNVTFGGGLFAADKNLSAPLIRLGETVATVCQADQINQKRSKFSISGIINLVFQEYESEQSSGQGAIIDLIEENLKGPESLKLNRKYRLNLTGLFGSSDYGRAKVNSLSSNSFGIPFVDAGDLARDENDNVLIGSNFEQNRTFFQILDSYQYNTFTAVLDVAAFFNWTLLGSVFEANSYGYNRQRDVIYQSFQNSTPNFACNYLFYPRNLDAGMSSTDVSSLTDFCHCIKEKNKLSVVILWMIASTSTVVIRDIREYCSGTESWTYLIADDFESSTPNVAQKSAQYLKNSLLLRNFGPWNFKAFLSNCLETASQEAKKFLLPIVDKLALYSYNCQLSSENGLEECQGTWKDRKDDSRPCHCTTQAFDEDPYASKYLFSADIMSVYAAGISLLQNNCSFLNEKLREALPNAKEFDFCSLETFTPEDLAFALRFVNITGYSGPIYFQHGSVLRAVKSYYLYSVYNNTFDAVLVGILNETGVQINVSSIQFVNDQVPVSQIVPQKIGLSYAVADVFFGIAIAELIVCFFILIFYIIHRKNSHIRKSSFSVSIAILFGIILSAAGQIAFSLEPTDALCKLALYLYRTGIILIISGLLVKNYRIYRIFENKSAAAVNLSENYLLLAIIALTFTYMLVVTLIIIINGFDAVLNYSSGNIYYQYIQCKVPNQVWDIILNVFLVAGFAVILLISLIFAWLTRNVHPDFRETNTLAAFFVVVTMSFIILVSLGYTFSDETDSQLFRYITTAEFTTVITISAIALLFLPKIYIISKQKRRLKARQSVRSN